MATDPALLDLAYLGQFVGMRVNELVLEKLAEAGYGDARYSHGFVFQHLMGGPRTITQLAELLGVTQQAASKTIAELIELGYVTTTDGPDKRARPVVLTDRGHACIAKTRAIRAQLQARFDKKHGAAVTKARQLLAAVLGDMGGLEAVTQRRIREPR